MADRELSSDESAWLQREADAFAVSWAAHGKDLNAGAQVRFNRFLILMVDEEKNMASGCSIDSSVQFIRDAGTHLNVDFFNRLLLAYRDDAAKVRTAELSALPALVESGAINASTPVFNNLVNSRKELEEAWETVLADSPYARFL
jgi:hypothetical protein